MLQARPSTTLKVKFATNDQVKNKLAMQKLNNVNILLGVTL